MPVGSKKIKRIETEKTYSKDYWLLEYLKEISNELTYLILIVASIFIYLMIDLLPAVPGSTDNLKLLFLILTLGGFGLFALSNITKTKIEKKFKEALSK
ncbi:MAG: hypothetical protein QW097_00200 [archaeon]